MNEIERYYYSKLVRFTRVKDQLVIRLSVPITKEVIVKAQSLYLPIYNPFPMPIAWSKTNSMEFFRVYEPFNDLWLFHGNRFTEIISRKHLQCHDSGNYVDCIRFKPHPVIPPTRCLNALMTGQFKPTDVFGTENDTVCETYQVSSKEYVPISLDDSRVCIHGSTKLNYALRCPVQADIHLDLAEDKGIECIDIKPSCVLQINDYTFPGPIQHLNRTFGFDFPGIPGKLVTVNDTTRIILPGNPLMPDLLLNISALKVTVVNRSPDRIDEIVRKIKRSAERIEARVNDSSSAIETGMSSTSTFGFILALENNLFRFVTFYILFVFVRGNTILELGAPSVTLLTSHTYAAVYDDIFGSFLSEVRTDFVLEHVTTFLWVVAVFFAITAYFTRSLFNRIYVANYYGRVEGSKCDFVILVNIGLTTHSFFHTLRESIVLEFPTNNNTDSKLKSCCNFSALRTICVFETDGQGQFSLSEKVIARGSNAGGKPIVRFFPEVNFDLTDLNWIQGRGPSFVKRASSGYCSVSFLRNPQLVDSNETSF